VIAVAPIILAAITVATITWTFSYANAAQRRARESGIQVD
jgi:hypothetical protein